MTTAPRSTYAAALRRLKELGDPKDAQFLQRFFKTGPGEYGEGDVFLGIRVPATRKVAREFRDLPLPDIEQLLHDKHHEARLLAVILLGDAYGRGTPEQRQDIFDLYLKNARRVNNWDLVDSSARAIVGAHLETRPRDVLDTLAQSDNLWERRISIIATHHFIANQDYETTLRLCVALMGDPEDLIHKATGWMLREVGAKDRAPLLEFLTKYAARMPRTMLRYAIEHLSADERQSFMSARGAHSGDRRRKKRS